MNTYSTSKGVRVTQKEIESRVRIAKRRVLEVQKETHGYNFCEDCGRSSGTYLDCSHTIPVKEAKEQGKAELCWYEPNIKIRCRPCHKKLDGLQLQFTKN